MSFVQAEIWRLQTFSKLASTQDHAITMANEGVSGSNAVLALAQQSGRGSHGRSWLSPPGNLNLSVLLRPRTLRPQMGLWALLAGVALYDALAPYSCRLSLKWPNDITVAGSKVGGILIESALRADGTIDWIVIGFGANLRTSPSIVGVQAACLPPPHAQAQDVACAVLEQIGYWRSRDVVSAWLARAHQLGTVLTVQTPTERIQGAFAGLSSAGELLLEGVPSPLSSAQVTLMRNVQ